MRSSRPASPSQGLYKDEDTRSRYDVERAAERRRQIWRLTMSSTRSRQRGPASSSIPTPTIAASHDCIVRRDSQSFTSTVPRSHSSTFTVGSPSSTPKCAELDSQLWIKIEAVIVYMDLAVWTTCADSRHLTSESLIPDVGVLPPAGRYRALIRHSLDESMLLSIVVPLWSQVNITRRLRLHTSASEPLTGRAAVVFTHALAIEQSSVPS